MENDLLGKTNRIRSSRSLYDNPFRNDNSLKTYVKETLHHFAKIVTDATGVIILVRPYSGT